MKKASLVLIMEQDQITSQFRPGQKDALISARDAWEESEIGYSHPSFMLKFLARLFRRFFREFNIFESDTFVHRTEEDRIVASFTAALSFLKDQGIVSATRRLEDRYNDAPAFSRFTIEGSYGEGSTDGNRGMRSYGSGFSKDIKTALSKAIGEFLERYFLTIYHVNDFIRGSCRDMERRGYPFLPPDHFAGFSSRQKEADPRFRWDHDSPFFWTRALRISDKKSVFLPAQFIFWNYRFGDDEPRLINPTTNGSGGMFSMNKAILAGLYELIQRDSFLIFWLNGLTPQKIDPRTVPDDDFRTIFEESARYRFIVHCLNITTDIAIPSFAVVIEDPGGVPRFSLGGGCDADPAKALRRALEEAWDVYYWLRSKEPYSLPERYEPFRMDSLSREERLRLWANPAMAERFSFLLSGEEAKFSDVHFEFRPRFGSATKELDYCLGRLSRFGPGYEAYYYPVRNPIVSRLGYFCVKAIVPQLVPLYLNEAYAPLGARRIREVPEKIGHHPATAWNPWPHPFP